MITLPARDFALAPTLTSGQAFRWTPHGGWWVGCLGAAVVRVRQTGDRLEAETSDPACGAAALAHYFALDVDLGDLLRQIDVDLQIHAAIVRHRGLRILRQEPWEVLAAFICSAFNNIQRIEGMLEGLCQAFGRPVALGPYRTFTFPTAAALADVPERRLRSLGLGYRAPYLRATARLVADGRLPFTQLRTLDYPALKAALRRCDGVGDKVADCVALFGFEAYAAFPVDVWIERAMRYYFRHRRMTRGRIHAYAQQHFGAYAGYAQQYLYHYLRHARAHPSDPWHRLHALVRSAPARPAPALAA